MLKACQEAAVAGPLDWSDPAVLAVGQSVFFVVIVIALRLIFGRRNDRSLVGINLDIADFGTGDDFYLIDPAML